MSLAMGRSHRRACASSMQHAWQQFEWGCQCLCSGCVPVLQLCVCVFTAFCVLHLPCSLCGNYGNLGQQCLALTLHEAWASVWW